MVQARFLGGWTIEGEPSQQSREEERGYGSPAADDTVEASKNGKQSCQGYSKVRPPG
ncbi:hypothetical protein HYE68_005922 [Fusarium pseudograminearum]|nr:hypothetical protein HYE68_005922 [Fusarium pseudograminearum]